MAAGLTATITLKPLNRHYKPILFPHLNKPILFNPLRCFPQRTTPKTQKLKSFTLCVLMNDPKQNTQIEIEEEKSPLQGENDNNYSQVVSPKMEEKLKRKKSERLTYLIAAVMSSLGITSMAVLSVYYRFSWQMEGGGEILWSEMFGTFALSVGAAVGMEFWARWAHKALWHASLWHMHESHHRAREGPFELNDVFAIINAVPAIALLNFGFFHKGLIPGLCFGALHHSDKFHGVPYGLFLGPKELEEVGGLEELEKEIIRRARSYNNSS
uniref:beta-carotene 3-hydroxylase n=1 Tax=Cicer arietinum TaxID=3827 RepID=A0A3Q7Y4U5_CICAR|nr:beta-carotene hydroxylase 2, chloroplastic-like isoform X2 [Cicer arietinum]